MGITRSSLFELKSKELILFILQTFVELLLCAVYHWGIKLKHSPCPQGVSSLAYKSNVKQLVELQSDRLGGGTTRPWKKREKKWWMWTKAGSGEAPAFPGHASVRDGGALLKSHFRSSWGLWVGGSHGWVEEEKSMQLSQGVSLSISSLPQNGSGEGSQESTW